MGIAVPLGNHKGKDHLRMPAFRLRQRGRRRRQAHLPPRDFGTRKQTACMRRAQSGTGEKCKQFGASLSFLALPPFPPVPGLPREKPLLANISCCGRQGGLRRKAHLEPLPSLRCKECLPYFVSQPATRPRLTVILSMPRPCAFADLPASGGADHPCLTPPIRGCPFGAAQGPKEGEAAPTEFLLTEPTARRERQP
jgi:hypothetical protein